MYLFINFKIKSCELYPFTKYIIRIYRCIPPILLYFESSHVSTM